MYMSSVQRKCPFTSCLTVVNHVIVQVAFLEYTRGKKHNLFVEAYISICIDVW